MLYICIFWLFCSLHGFLGERVRGSSGFVLSSHTHLSTLLLEFIGLIPSFLLPTSLSFHKSGCSLTCSLNIYLLLSFGGDYIVVVCCCWWWKAVSRQRELSVKRAGNKMHWYLGHSAHLSLALLHTQALWDRLWHNIHLIKDLWSISGRARIFCLFRDIRAEGHSLQCLNTLWILCIMFKWGI